MLATAHTLIGLPLGIYLDNIWLIFVLSFLLHLAADALPHWNIYLDRFNRYPVIPAFFDVAIGLIASYAVLGNMVFSWQVLAAIAGSNMPDVLSAINRLSPIFQSRWLRFCRTFFYWHDRIQWELTSVTRGLISQVIGVVVAICLVWYGT